jgi:electron transport complex protein RnfD
MDAKLIISLSPHIHSGKSVERCMWNVVIALIPTLITAIWVFGPSALLVLALSVLSCMLTEWVIDRYVLHCPSTLYNGSALITGLLLGCNLPNILPWWMVVIGGVVAIGVGKMSFGGLGCNIWNPALVGRVFLLISFPAAMTTWDSTVGSGLSLVHTGASADATSGATILASLNDMSHPIDLSQVDLLSMGLGNMNGSLGEVGSIAILIGLAYLLITRTISWHIPVSMIGGAALFSWAIGCNPLLDILAGGLLLGAVFMATDYVTSPMTHKGQIIFGVLIGVITIIIRRFGSYPEGVSFAILLMNSFVPLINHYCKPRRYGERSRR